MLLDHPRTSTKRKGIAPPQASAQALRSLPPSCTVAHGRLVLYSAPLNYLQLTPFHLGRTGHPSLMGSALCGQRWWGGEHPKAEKDTTVPTKEQPGEYAGRRREHWTESPGLTFSSALEPQPGLHLPSQYLPRRDQMSNLAAWRSYSQWTKPGLKTGEHERLTATVQVPKCLVWHGHTQKFHQKTKPENGDCNCCGVCLICGFLLHCF